MVRMRLGWLACGPAMLLTTAAAPSTPAVPVEQRFAALALACLHREYPNKITHVLDDASDARTPRALHPVFYGCLDWHSSVHGHWLLVRLLRRNPDGPAAADVAAALDSSFTPINVAGEVAYFQGRRAFERPYGLAWLLLLTAELREWDDPRARRWMATLAPLEAAALDRLRPWMRDLAYPIRVGVHENAAFALAAALDWSKAAGDPAFGAAAAEAARRFYAADRACPLSYEPSGEDFLSPCLAEADLMRRLLSGTAYARWLRAFLPGIPTRPDPRWLPVGIVNDPSDGKLLHLAGLNLSRAWSLDAIAAALPSNDPRRAGLLEAARRHQAAGLATISADNYDGSHWLGTFAVYLLSERWRR